MSRILRFFALTPLLCRYRHLNCLDVDGPMNELFMFTVSPLARVLFCFEVFYLLIAPRSSSI